MRFARRSRRPSALPEESGFTLVEMVVAISILGVVLATLFGVLDVSTRAEARSESFLQNQQDVRLVLDRVGRDVRGAVSLNDLSKNRSGVIGSYSHKYDGKTVADAPYLAEFDTARPTTFTDGVITTGTTLTSASAAFAAGDVGAAVSGVSIVIGTTISARTSATQVILSVAGTNGTSTTFSIIRLSTWRWWLDPSSNTLNEQKWNAASLTFVTQFSLTNARNFQTGVAMLRYYRAGDGAELTPNTGGSAASDLANCTIHIHLAISADSNPGPIPFTMESDVELRNRLPGGIPQC